LRKENLRSLATLKDGQTEPYWGYNDWAEAIWGDDAVGGGSTSQLAAPRVGTPDQEMLGVEGFIIFNMKGFDCTCPLKLRGFHMRLSNWPKCRARGVA
jgi:hypothetical protein